MTTANEIPDKLASEHDLTKAQGKSLLDGAFKAKADAAEAGEEVSIPGFGKFKVKATAEREGRNPSTGAAIKIAAANKLTFAPAMLPLFGQDPCRAAGA